VLVPTGDRKSEAEIPPLIEDPVELAKREASNALDQFDWAMEELGRWIKADQPTLKLSVLLKLHRLAMDGIDQYAGNFRPASVAIKGSNHVPIAGDDVPRYVEEMLEYVAENWKSRTAIHLAAFVMWRLNWIHPFADGNGRTSRILSYLVLCGRLGQLLPGTRTIPEQIAENKDPYYQALEKADLHFKKGVINVSDMESLLEKYLANQLVQLHEQATGSSAFSPPTNHSNEKRSPIRSAFDSMEARPVLWTVIVGVGGVLLAIWFG
jgi:Fic family protein